MNDQIQIIKHADNKIPIMASNKDYLMGFGRGIAINADKNKESRAGAFNDYFLHPENTANLRIENGWLYFSRGNGSFKSLDVEVWGLY